MDIKQLLPSEMKYLSLSENLSRVYNGIVLLSAVHWNIISCTFLGK